MAAPGSRPSPAGGRWTVGIGVVVVVGLLLVPAGLARFASSGAPAPHEGTAVPVSIVPAGGAIPSVPPLAGPSASPWVNVTGTLNVSPPSRSGPMMTYDAADGYVVLYGGLGNRGALGDTWIFQNRTWKNITATTIGVPGPRFKGGITYDAADGYVLLFGGQAGGPSYFNDTWEFSGGHWTQLFPTTHPSSREDTMMTYDAADGYVVLFAGEQLPIAYLNDTWKFVGGQWTNITATVSAPPPARESAAMGFDPVGGYVVLFGGKPTETSTEGDTWTYAAGVWTNVSGGQASSPGPREGSQMTYDGADGYLLLYGGLKFPNPLNDSWAFVGGHWLHVTPATSPPARFAPGLAYDPSGGFGVAILFGGQLSASSNSSNTNDTWAFKVPLGATVTVSPGAIDVGATVNVSAQELGGYAPITYTWQGLPPSCAPGAGLSFTCAPTDLGTWGIELNVSDSAGANAVSAPANLTIAPYPVLSVGASPLLGLAPLNVAFNATLSGGVAPFAYTWLFGDGGSAASANLSHTYVGAGSFNATLTVLDATGTTVAAAAPTVTAVGGLAATISASPTSGVVPLTVDLSAAPVGGRGPYTYAWTFDGSSTGTGATTSFAYNVSGAYTPTVTVTDALGQTATASVDVTAYAALSASFTYTLGAPACVDGMSQQVADFTAVVSGGSGGTNYYWEFPNTSIPNAPTVAYAVIFGINYSIDLIATDNANDSTDYSGMIPASALTGANCATAAGSSTSSFPWIWVLIAVIAIAVAVELLIMARRGRGPPPAPAPASAAPPTPTEVAPPP